MNIWLSQVLFLDVRGCSKMKETPIWMRSWTCWLALQPVEKLNWKFLAILYTRNYHILILNGHGLLVQYIYMWLCRQVIEKWSSIHYVSYDRGRSMRWHLPIYVLNTAGAWMLPTSNWTDGVSCRVWSKVENMPSNHIPHVCDSYFHSQTWFNIIVMVLAVLNSIVVEMISPGFTPQEWQWKTSRLFRCCSPFSRKVMISTCAEESWQQLVPYGPGTQWTSFFWNGHYNLLTSLLT